MTPSDEARAFRITIDDLGLYRGVEASALDLAAGGQVLNCSWVTNYYPPSPVYLATKNLRSGLHFNVLEGQSELKSKSLVNGDGRFSRSWPEFLLPSRQMRIDVEAELEWQLNKVREWFGRVSHLDSHLHLHGIPWIHKLARRKQEKYGVAHVRNPYQPFSDRWSCNPRVVILWLLHLNTRSSAEPCFGIDPLFRMSARHCLRVMRGSLREFIWHPFFGDDEPDPSDYRFLEPSHMRFRRQEHQGLKEFLRALRAAGEKTVHPPEAGPSQIIST